LWSNALYSPRIGLFTFANTIQRVFPIKTDSVTNETVHPSVLSQTIELPPVDANLKQNPALLNALLPLEELFKAEWPYVPGQPIDKIAKEELESQESEKRALVNMAKKAVAEKLKTEIMTDEAGTPRYEESWLGKIIHEVREVCYLVCVVLLGTEL